MDDLGSPVAAVGGAAALEVVGREEKARGAHAGSTGGGADGIGRIGWCRGMGRSLVR